MSLTIEQVREQEEQMLQFTEGFRDGMRWACSAGSDEWDYAPQLERPSVACGYQEGEEIQRDGFDRGYWAACEALRGVQRQVVSLALEYVRSKSLDGLKA